VSKRDILLDAISEAGRLHREMQSQQLVETRGGGVDVFGAILQLSVPLVFRPLDKLLGAFVPRPSAGIIVTTQRSLAVQRFTASHELGHFILGHAGSLDDDSILNRSPFGAARYNNVEAAADAFAASFLMPKWLFEVHAVRQGWNANTFVDSRVVYQLSLRAGASYEATCRALQRYNVISSGQLEKHLSTTPKEIKKSLLTDHHMDKWYPDVWVLTERDQGALIQGGPNDIFLVHLKENSGAGYLWNTDQLQEAGFTVVSDERLIRDDSETVGGAVDRVLVAASQFEAAGTLDLIEARPWDESSENAHHFTLLYELLGKENGMPRAQRAKVAAA
jgi:Zn-dependent peptidase ImmA (M78 family)/predicted secreted protein